MGPEVYSKMIKVVVFMFAHQEFKNLVPKVQAPITSLHKQIYRIILITDSFLRGLDNKE